MKFNVKDYSTDQLKAIDHALEAMIFKQLSQEPFESSYKADPKQFRKLINLMISYKSDLMKYFSKQYNNRYRLIRQGVVRASQYDDYFYEDEWNMYQAELASIIEEHNKKAYGLGIIALALAIGLTGFNFTPEDAQRAITDAALKSAGDITTTTRKRIAKQIEASLELNEQRAEFDTRLQDVFRNPYRGRFIAQQEALTSYLDGKRGLANEQGMTKKTWLGAQALDKICGDVNGETVGIDEKFSNGLDGPLAHFGCRCDLKYSQ